MLLIGSGSIATGTSGTIQPAGSQRASFSSVATSPTGMAPTWA